MTRTDEALSRLRGNAWRWNRNEQRYDRVDEDVAVVESELSALRELEKDVARMSCNCVDPAAPCDRCHVLAKLNDARAKAQR